MLLHGPHMAVSFFLSVHPFWFSRETNRKNIPFFFWGGGGVGAVGVGSELQTNLERLAFI